MEFMKYEGEWYVWTLEIISIIFVLIMPKKSNELEGAFYKKGCFFFAFKLSVNSFRCIFQLFRCPIKKQNLEEKYKKIN